MLLHLRDRVFHQPKHTVKIDGECGAPLLVRHALDGHVFHRPHAVVRNQNVEPAKVFDRFGDQRFRRLRSIQVAGNSKTRRRAAVLN